VLCFPQLTVLTDLDSAEAEAPEQGCGVSVTNMMCTHALLLIGHARCLRYTALAKLLKEFVVKIRSSELRWSARSTSRGLRCTHPSDVDTAATNPRLNETLAFVDTGVSIRLPVYDQSQPSRSTPEK
jgi:hypothetical protein